MRKIFITGTDTNIGKTYTCIKMLKNFNQQGLRTIGIKPVATGSINGRNEDALLLKKHSSVQLNYSLINPFTYKPAVSPNIADSYLTANKIWNALQETLKVPADIYIIEGVGGWLVPINLKETMSDLVQKFEIIEIILVVGIKLGCLNHAFLTYESIKAKGLSITGWVANVIDPKMEEIGKNISTLKAYIKEPCLEIIDYERYR